MSRVDRFNAAFLVLLAGIAACVGWLYHRNDPPRHVTNLVIATLVAPFGGEAIYFLPRQRVQGDGARPFGISQVTASRTIAIAKENAVRSLATARGLLLILMISLAAALVAQVYARRSRLGVTRERVLRGPRKVDFTSVAHRIHDAIVVCLQDTFWKPDLRVRLGQVRLEAGDETQHMLLVGGTGSGKSAAIQGLLADLLCWRPLAKVVVLDLTGALYRQFGRPGDLVINPFWPTTSVKWSPLHEVHESTVMLDCARIAAGLLPGDGTPQNQEWSQFARPVLSSVLKRLFERGASSTEFARVADPTHLEELTGR